MKQRLREMGEWLKINGEAIYGTKTWAEAPLLPKESNIFFTRKGKDLYAFTPAGFAGSLTIHGVSKEAKTQLLAIKKTIQNRFLRRRAHSRSAGHYAGPDLGSLYVGI